MAWTIHMRKYNTTLFYLYTHYFNSKHFTLTLSSFYLDNYLKKIKLTTLNIPINKSKQFINHPNSLYRHNGADNSFYLYTHYFHFNHKQYFTLTLSFSYLDN